MSNFTPNQASQPKSIFFTISGALLLLTGNIAFFANLAEIGGFTLDICEKKYDIALIRDICERLEELQIKNTDPTDVVEPKKEPSKINSSEKNGPILFKRAKPTSSEDSRQIRLKRSQ